MSVFKPTISLSPTSGKPGDGVTVSGSGWPAGDFIFVQIGPNIGSVCGITAASDGTINATKETNGCTVPNVPAGGESAAGVDNSARSVTASAGTFTVSPVLLLTPSAESQGGPASPGATVTIAGHGFAAGATVSNFKFDGVALTTTPSSVLADANGNISSVTFTVPSTSAGNHTVSGSDGTNTGSANQTVFTPTVSVTPGSGPVGTGLNVTGDGWPANDGVWVQIGSATAGTDVVCFLTATSTGHIQGNQSNPNCQVPSVATGSQPLVGIDNNQRAVTVTGTPFTVGSGPALGVPATPLSPASGSASPSAGSASRLSSSQGGTTHKHRRHHRRHHKKHHHVSGAKRAAQLRLHTLRR
jgi:hypothetical protein